MSPNQMDVEGVNKLFYLGNLESPKMKSLIQ